MYPFTLAKQGSPSANFPIDILVATAKYSPKNEEAGTGSQKAENKVTAATAAAIINNVLNDATIDKHQIRQVFIENKAKSQYHTHYWKYQA